MHERGKRKRGIRRLKNPRENIKERRKIPKTKGVEKEKKLKKEMLNGGN
jgi:hypothetical protein